MVQPHPWYNQPNTEHPAAVVAAMVDGVDNTPDAVESVHRNARYSAVSRRCGDGPTVDQDAQSHSRRARIVVGQHSGHIQCDSQHK